MKQHKDNSTAVLKNEIRVLEFRKEPFEVFFHYYEDEKLGIQYTTTKLDELNMTQLLNKYREKHNLPFPEEIKNIREHYGLSASKMSDILGFGANTYRQYEAGEVPSGANAKIIRMAEDPLKFLSLVEMCEEIEDEFKRKLSVRIKEMIKEHGGWIQIPLGGDPFADDIKPSAFNGYKKPDINKFSNVIKLVAEKIKPYKTGLNKILFYIDFLNYKRHGHSITGCEYSAIQMGPVPNWFESTYERLAEKNEFDLNYVSLPDGNYGVQFKARWDNRFDETLFSESEIQTIEDVIKHLGKKRANELINLSHKEAAWIDNHENKKLIEYHYAFKLKAL
jgi:DNA-binding transcriptional regulator YiaG/uncharacterized phage-associated protein